MAKGTMIVVDRDFYGRDIIEDEDECGGKKTPGCVKKNFRSVKKGGWHAGKRN